MKRSFLIMGFLSFFTSCKEKPADVIGHAPPQEQAVVVIDLAQFRIGDSPLGELPAAKDFFAASLEGADTFHEEALGLELGTKDRVIDYAFITLSEFSGKFLLDGVGIDIGTATSEADIERQFGEPYWIDRSDGGTIMFYEYVAGTVELQFEFPEATTLGFVTLSRDGVLSTAEQRKAFGVDKPWPPEG